MLTTDEKHAFAQRLLLALKRSKKKIDGPAALALQFNLRHHNEPITPQAAYKWLHGIALPSPDKIDTLAEWLNVSPHWLRFGPPDAVKANRTASGNQVREGGGTYETLSAEEKKLLARLRGMSEQQRHLVGELVEQLALQSEVWPGG
jgi:transcriptional regulator with XRE-family HTH domain